MGLLEGKVAVITGAGRGIGRAIAMAFAREGAAVVVNDSGCARDGTGSDPSVAEAATAELLALGGRAVASPHSVERREEVEALFELALRSFERVDILVNNAGVIADKSLFDMSDEQWQRVIDTHLTGSFLCSQAAARAFKKQRAGGNIVNMTSVSGLLGNLAQSNESAAKAGIYGLTRTSSIELQRYGVRVNAIAPIARTRLTEDLPMFEKVEGTLEPEHVAPLAVYLASELAEDVSGMALGVAGGRISAFQLVESPGRLKEADGGLWTPQEIHDNFSGITRT
jgi:NAD(P)-dependent dehydrogenase (short-subunit alcohol dehydrogenase family)